MYRNYNDIQDSFESVKDIVEWYGANNNEISKYHGPGAWNDPDMMIVGDFSLSVNQAKAHMALWCVLAAPMLISADVRSMPDEYAEILLNSAAIAVNQDALGFMGKRIKSASENDGIEIWTKQINPVVDRGNLMYSFAIVIWNLNTDGMPRNFNRSIIDYGLYLPDGYAVEDIFSGQYYGHFFPESQLSVEVNPSGGVVFLRANATDIAGEKKFAESFKDEPCFNEV